MYQNGNDTAYAYAYDNNGNITEIMQGSTSVTYEYNGANELIREYNGLIQPHDYLLSRDYAKAWSLFT